MTELSSTPTEFAPEVRERLVADAAEIPRISAHASMPSGVTRPSALCTRCSIGSRPERAWG